MKAEDIPERIIIKVCDTWPDIISPRIRKLMLENLCQDLFQIFFGCNNCNQMGVLFIKCFKKFIFFVSFSLFLLCFPITLPFIDYMFPFYRKTAPLSSYSRIGPGTALNRICTERT